MKKTVQLFCVIFFLSSTVIYAETLNLRGSWESTDQNNRWKMCVTWSSLSSRWEGHLSKNGYASGVVGFSVGELVWVATPTSSTSRLKEQQKYRWGRNGVSTGFEWDDGIVYLLKSTNVSLVTSTSTFNRMSTLDDDSYCAEPNASL